MTRNGVESLDFNMLMPDWEEKCRRIGENPNTIFEAVGERHQRVKRNGSIYLCGSGGGEPQPEYRQCTSVGAVRRLLLIDARYL